MLKTLPGANRSGFNVLFLSLLKLQQRNNHRE